MVLFLVCIAVSMESQELRKEIFYLGTFTSEGAEGISLCSFDTASGEIAVKEVFKGVDNPNYLQISPDREFLYVVSRSPQATGQMSGNLLAYRIKTGGILEFINKQPSQGDDPCYVDVSSDGKWVAVANYGSGSVALFPVSEKGFLQPASSVIQHIGSGHDLRRQASAHAHSIRFFVPQGLIYAADLGVDRLYVYKTEPETGRLIPASQPYVSLPPGSGPRHFEFSRNGTRCYVANELSSTVSVLENRENHLKLVQTVSTLPAGFSGTNYGADIHLSGDGKILYVSNRGDQSIAIFKTLEDGTLGAPVHVATHGNWPRNFALDPSGNFMLVANQRSHNITVFRMEKGIPVFTGKELKTPAPVCIKFL